MHTVRVLCVLNHRIYPYPSAVYTRQWPNKIAPEYMWPPSEIRVNMLGVVHNGNAFAGYIFICIFWKNKF